LLTARAVTGMKAARAQCRLLCGTWEPLASMRRENSKWWTHEEESTDAGRSAYLSSVVRGHFRYYGVPMNGPRA